MISLSAPKSGSHVLAHALGLRDKPIMDRAETDDEIIEILTHTKRKRFWTHIPYSKKIRDCLFEQFGIVFFIRRDPRDIVVSLSYFLVKWPRSFVNYWIDGKPLSARPKRERMLLLIKKLGSELRQYSGWISEPNVYQVIYEEVIDDRESVFAGIREYLILSGVDVDPLDKMVWRSQHHINRLVYRNAVYGDWKKEFDLRHVAHVAKYLMPVMEEWGYV